VLLYDELAHWWPLLSAPEEYEEEAAFYAATLQEACDPRTVLELGSGGGNNASHMKAHFDMTLVDQSHGMLDVSRALNPECVHLPGNMRSVRLGREFDAVFVHDAICYMTTEAALRSVFDTAYVHCREGGVALFCPDYVRENFREGTDHGGYDGDGRAMRYMDWTWDPDPSDTEYLVDMVYVMREGDAEPRVEQERWVEGLFSEQRWLDLMADAGFEPEIRRFDHSDGPLGAVLFLGTR
jgi:SAM-dependent methyltransferase